MTCQQPGLRRLALAVTAALAGLGSLATVQAAPAAGTPAAQAVQRAATTDRLIVKYRGASTVVVNNGRVSEQAVPVAAADMDQRLQVVRSHAQSLGRNVQLLRQTGLGAHVMRLDRHVSVAEVQRLADQLRASDASIEYAEPDLRMYPALVPNDTYYGTYQWDLSDNTVGIRAPAAWDLATGTGVVVAVLDTGIRPHADLSGQTVAGYDFIADVPTANDGDARDSDPSDPGDWVAANECATGDPAGDSSWHGTHVAGTIAAKTNNALGVAGIAFNAKVQPVRVLGKCGGYLSDIADAITWASGGTVTGVAANATPAKVINMSLGGSSSTCPTTYQSAITAARNRGTNIVVAAGNEGVNASGSTPANCTGVVTVAATDRTGARAYYSNFGTLVTLAAPGGDMRTNGQDGILSTLNDGTTVPGADVYAFYQGTSMATPHVAGVVALMLSAKPTATPDQVKAALVSSARAFPGSCSGCGAGLLDAAAAVAAITATTPPPTGSTEVESNNTRATANLVSAPTLMNGTLSSTTDTDYFRVNLPAGKTLTASLNPGAKDYDLYLYNSSGTRIATSVKGAGQVDTVTYANGGSSTVTLYVRVLYYSGGVGSYTLNLGW